jgi:hypothetical protein
MSLLEQFHLVLGRFLRAEISEADLVSSVVALKSSRSRAFQVTDVKVTVISGNFQHLPPNLNVFVQVQWGGDETKAQRTEIIKRAGSAPVWGTSKVLAFARPSDVVSANILSFEVRAGAVFGGEAVLGQGEVYLPSLANDSNDLKERFGLTKVTITPARENANSKLKGTLDTQLVVDAESDDDDLVLPAKPSSAEIAFEQLINGNISEEDFLQLINGHRRYCKSQEKAAAAKAAKEKEAKEAAKAAAADAAAAAAAAAAADASGGFNSPSAGGGKGGGPPSPRARQRGTPKTVQLSDVGNMAMRQLAEGTITQEECDRIIANDSQFREDQEAAQEELEKTTGGGGGGGGGKGAKINRRGSQATGGPKVAANTRFDESGKWVCMNTPSETETLPWEDFIKQCGLLDEVLNDSIHRKIRQDTAAAAVSNIQGLDALCRSQDWGFELRELKNSIIASLAEKQKEWKEKQAGACERA